MGLVGQFGLRGGIGALAADLNVDGRVDLTDFAIMRGAYGNSLSIPTFPQSERFNQDQSVTLNGLMFSFLTSGNVDDTSIVVTDTNNTLPAYIRGVDYQIRKTGEITEIARLGGGVIVDGQTVFVDYIELLPEAGLSPPWLPISGGSSATTLHRAATTGYDLRPLSNDPLANDPGDDLLADVLEEAVSFQLTASS